MFVETTHHGAKLKFDLLQPIDISIPLVAGEGRLEAWYVPPISIEPVRGDGFVGSIAEGGSVNFRDIKFNPHGHGTHTECLGHITKEWHSVNELQRDFHMLATVITVAPLKGAGAEADDLVITPDMIPQIETQALIVRTEPNNDTKTTKQYSSSNPPYLLAQTMEKVVKMGVEHILIDLPSVDREVDAGVLASHHVFWNVPDKPRINATITELIYVPNEIEDGVYLLNLQTAPFENDATPSRPVLFPQV